MYDARGGENTNNGTLFAICLGGVVALAFAAVAFWPSASDNGPPQSSMAEQSTSINALLPGTEEQKFAQVLKQVDEKAYLQLEQRLKRDGSNDLKRQALLMETAQDVAYDHIDALAKSDVKHMDALLNDIMAGLQTASRSKTKLCKGSTYSALENMNQLQMGSFLEREIVNNASVQEFAVKLNRRILEAILDGRKNPKSYGKPDQSDKRALNALGPKLMSDPKIMRLIMAASTSANPQDALASIDVCDLSVSVLRVVDRLPEKTKARLWASSFDEVKKQGSFAFDPSSISQFGGF